MPIQTDPLFEIRMRQEFLGAACVNFFYFRHNTATTVINKEEFAIQFRTDVLNVVADIQSVDLENVDVRVREFGDPNEFVLVTSATPGTRAGNPLNSFSAWGFILVRNTIDIRNGSKRFAGIAEDDVTGNEPVVPFEGNLDDVAAALSENIEMPNSAVAIPVIYRRDSFDEGTWFGGNFGTARFTAITSQVSRKVRPE